MGDVVQLRTTLPGPQLRQARQPRPIPFRPDDTVRDKLTDRTGTVRGYAMVPGTNIMGCVIRWRGARVDNTMPASRLILVQRAPAAPPPSPADWPPGSAVVRLPSGQVLRRDAGRATWVPAPEAEPAALTARSIRPATWWPGKNDDPKGAA
ncbi:hypothetical protein FFK22_008960 [Mycobacterium sp. KBS0706]|uniref:hypothetical protein n=1 Tax=Mycobacterium sp. KBS0706 TaxID=2578109 RepID=UPI00110FF66E|nr:hypothetical protein [Mycobacterium sp. KBS0706]TSD89099.1 hypothetical protein FFK22_008960 [Mycobacterium sp. KBS0706]